VVGLAGLAGATFGTAGAEEEFVFAGPEALPFFAEAAGAVGAIVAGGVTGFAELAVADVTGTRFPFASVVVCWTGTAFASKTFATKSA
jgi:hypothetical protein